MARVWLWNSVPSRHMANTIRLRRRASATIAMRRPRRAANVCAHVRNAAPSAVRPRQIAQLAWISKLRNSGDGEQEARRRARVEFGGLEQSREQCRAID